MVWIFWIGLRIIIVILLLFVFAILPFMAFFNKMTDKSYKADEDAVLVGKLTVGIKGIDALGEVLVEGASFSLTTRPAKIYQQAGKTVTEIAKDTQVLVIEVEQGIAYVIPYEGHGK